MPVHRPLFRAAIIGTGGIANAHADALRALSDRVELVAVADIDESRARAFADAHSATSVYTDAEQLLASERLDLVHICTPPQTHVPLALAAARVGVVSLVEKPVALSLDELDRLVEAEEATGVPILTVFQHRFGRAAVRLRGLVESGALGRPQVATCETQWYRPDDYFDVPWRGRWEVEGGGPTMGHGIHQFDLLLATLGPWRRLSAFAARQSRPTDTEDVSLALVEFQSGALATVVNSVVSPHETSRLRFDFEHATVEVEHLYGYTDDDWTFTPAPGHEHLAEVWSENSDGAISSHQMQIASILDALGSGEHPGVDIYESRRTLEFAAATYASAFGGRIVEAGEIGRGHPFARSMDGGVVPWAPAKERVA